MRLLILAVASLSVSCSKPDNNCVDCAGSDTDGQTQEDMSRSDVADPVPDQGVPGDAGDRVDSGPDMNVRPTGNWYPGIPEPPMPWWDDDVGAQTLTAAAGEMPAGVDCGDVVVWSGDAGRVEIDAEGCDDDPIWIVGDGVTATAPSGNAHIVSGSNLVIIGVDFRGEDGTLGFTGDRVVLRDIQVSDPDTSNGSAFFIRGSNLVVSDSIIGPSGNWIDSGGPDVDHHCIKTSQANSIWILRSELKECQGDGIQIGDQNDDGGSFFYIAGNQIYDNCQTGVWLKRGSDVVVVGNQMWGHDQGCQSTPAAAGAQYANQWFTFAYNEVWDNGGGIQIQSAEDGPRFIIGNVIRDCTIDPGGNAHLPHGVTNRASGNETYILHNTIDNCAGAIGVVNGSATTVYGNIFGGGSQDYEGNLAEESSNIAGDGQLDANWVPMAGSPAVDASGDTHAAYEMWEAHYGLSITNDRPSGAAWDIGAHERQ